MLDFLISYLLISFIMLIKFPIYIYIAILSLCLIYIKFKNNKARNLDNNKTKAKMSLKKDLEAIFKFSNSNIKIKNKIFHLISIAGVLIWTTYSEYVGTRFFNYSYKFLIIYAIIAPFISTLLIHDSPIHIYLSHQELSLIDRNFDSLFYDKIRSINIHETDSYNKNFILTYLENLKEKMTNYILVRNTFNCFLSLTIANFLIILMFGGKILFFKIIVSYFIFYCLVILNFNTESTSIIKLYTDSIKNKSNKLGYAFSDFRNMIFYNHINKDCTYIDFLSRNNEQVGKYKLNYGISLSKFIFKFNVFKRYIYCLTLVIYISNMSNITTPIQFTTCIIVLWYVFLTNDQLYFLIENFYNLKKLKNEYENSSFLDLENGNYRKFLENKANDLKLDNDYIWIRDNKIDKKLNYLKAESGKGKTSILRALVYQNPVFVKKIAYFNQELELDIENILIKEVVQGFEKIYDEKKINQALKIACVNNKFKIDSHIENISGGEKQRFRIARIVYYCLISDCSILIMDEPDNNLDFKIFSQIMKNLSNISSIKNIIFTSHKPDIVKFFDSKEVNIIEL
ncbi:hypothetical protein CPAV1605_1111 [seawater metagenome]|uniref:ABC transporter domain-containing protein n=1 Tax=seawater metagenome TaxID=1561972 RepID=A0A5E8CMG6_9ZZZZ